MRHLSPWVDLSDIFGHVRARPARFARCTQSLLPPPHRLKRVHVAVSVPHDVSSRDNGDEVSQMTDSRQVVVNVYASTLLACSSVMTESPKYRRPGEAGSEGRYGMRAEIIVLEGTGAVYRVTAESHTHTHGSYLEDFL